MTTKLAITTNKHKTVTQLCSAALAVLGALALNPLNIAICSRMQKWKTKPDISCRWTLASWFTVFRITGRMRWMIYWITIVIGCSRRFLLLTDVLVILNVVVWIDPMYWWSIPSSVGKILLAKMKTLQKKRINCCINNFKLFFKVKTFCRSSLRGLMLGNYLLILLLVVHRRSEQIHLSHLLLQLTSAELNET
jgi:hypothetical protein